jgi:hypothetical protein
VFKIYSFTGRQQEFSPGGNYLLAIKNKHLTLYPASVKELFRLVNDQKIFGKIKPSKKNYDKWYILNISVHSIL